MGSESQKPPKWDELSIEFISTCVVDEPFFFFVYDEIDVADVAIEKIPSAFYIRMSLGKMTRYRNDMAFLSLMRGFDYNGKLSLHDLIMRLLMLYVEFCVFKKPGLSPYIHIQRWIDYVRIISEDNFPSVVDWCNHRFRDNGVSHYFTNIWRTKRKDILHSKLNLDIKSSRFKTKEVESYFLQPERIDAEKKSANTQYSISKQKSKIIRIYEFAIETSVFSNQITEAQFIVAIEKADISEIYNSSGIKKCKVKRILKRINLYMGNKDWYKDVTASIETTPKVCSGANTNDVNWNEAFERL